MKDTTRSTPRRARHVTHEQSVYIIVASFSSVLVSKYRSEESKTSAGVPTHRRSLCIYVNKMSAVSLQIDNVATAAHLSNASSQTFTDRWCNRMLEKRIISVLSQKDWLGVRLRRQDTTELHFATLKCSCVVYQRIIILYTSF